MIDRRKPSAGGSSKQVDKQAATLQIPTPVIAVVAPPPVEAIGSKVVSTAEAWDYCRCVTEFLEGLKNRVANREGNPFFPFNTSAFRFLLIDS
jgi:hypothetical protein